MFLKKYFLLLVAFACLTVVCARDAFACAVGEYNDNGTCTPCSPGVYCQNDVQLTCLGAQCVSVDGENCSAEPGATSCIQCPEDAPFANFNHTACVACGNVFELVDNGVCTQCQVGHFSNREHNACSVECGPGSYVRDGVCTLCPAGDYCVGDGLAVPCPGATVAPEPGATQCDACTGNSSVANSSHTHCVACDGDAEYIKDGVCTVCADGYYVKNNHTICAECTAGYYCDGTGGRQLCPKGSFSASGKSACTYCAAGYTTAGPGTAFNAAMNLSAICTKIDIKLKVGSGLNSFALPSCLKEGAINKSVVKNN